MQQGGDLNWQGLDQWQQWALAIGGSLAAASLVWVCTRLFGRRKRTESITAVQQNASPVMTQHFQPTINIHTPGAGAPPSDPSLRVKLAFGCLTYEPGLGPNMLLFTVANPSDRPVQLKGIRVPLKSGANLFFPDLEGERRLPCVIEPGTSVMFWVELSDVEASFRGRNCTGPIALHAVATDALGNEHVSNSVDIGH